MTRHLSRRLERLEERAQEVAAAAPEPHTLWFISADQKVVSTFEMGTDKWAHFDPPRDRAEFEPIIQRRTRKLLPIFREIVRSTN